MALWLNRAGSHGEYEKAFFDNSRIYLTWNGLKYDLSGLETMRELYDLLPEFYPDWSKGKRTQYTGQIWSFSQRMEPGDWVVLPGKLKRGVIHIGEITGPYVFDPKAEDPYYHYRNVKWIATNIPRTNFDQDILYSTGAFTTICGIKRNDAEKRVRAMAATNWKMTPPGLKVDDSGDTDTDGESVDLDQLGRDAIAKLILAKFKGHGMAQLVDAILKVQGYTTHVSPAGPDKGIDILAAPGPMGFGQPRICVQVKSGDSPVDRPTMDQLIGTMQNVQAEQGLLVSWGGFKPTVDKETATQFFRVRLWDREALIDQLLEHYDEIDPDIRAELPLKQIWTIATPDEQD